MTLNPFHGTGLFGCPLKPSGNLWFSDVVHSGSIEKCQCHEMGYNCQQNADIHTCSVTEHAFLQSICTGSFNALKWYKISMFSGIS